MVKFWDIFETLFLSGLLWDYFEDEQLKISLQANFTIPNDHFSYLDFQTSHEKSIENFSFKIFIIEVHEKKLAIRECEGVFGAWEVSGVKVRVKHNSESKKIISK